MNLVKKNQGITLIALIVTIIVLLILAGITISQITGSESAPAKANEAGQKNDIGAAKDDISLTVTNAQMEAYESVYVDGKQPDTNEAVTAENASTNVGTYVRKKIYEKYKASEEFKIGLALIVANENGEITITTTDFTEYGLIDLSGGSLSWITPVPITTLGAITALNKQVKETKTITLTAEINTDATESLTWTSSNPNVATVTSTGKNTAEVRGLAEQAGNSVTITASYGDLTPATIEITVIENVVESYVGKYADLNDDGKITAEADGIIFADLLAKDPTGQWINLDGEFTMPPSSTNVTNTNVKDYEINTTKVVAKDSYNNNLFDSTEREIVNLKGGTGTEKRFYVMKLKNESGTSNWSTSCKKTATTGAYTWVLPTKEQWAMFGKAFKINMRNYTNYNLAYYYWSSTEDSSNTNQAWLISFGDGYMRSLDKTYEFFVRLCTTF